LDELATAVSQALSHTFLDIDVETGVENGRLLAALAAHGEVLSRRYTDSRVIVHCRLPQRAMGHLHSPGTVVRSHGSDQALLETNGAAGGSGSPRIWPVEAVDQGLRNGASRKQP
jgi:GTP-binding protein HflX